MPSTDDFDLQLQPSLHFPHLQYHSSTDTMGLFVTFSVLLSALGTTCVHAGSNRCSDVRVISMHDSRDVIMGKLHHHPRLQAHGRLTSFQLEVKQVEVLGNLSSGGTQLLGPITAGQLASEPGFEP